MPGLHIANALVPSAMSSNHEKTVHAMLMVLPAGGGGGIQPEEV
jgi:hypothetical protein